MLSLHNVINSIYHDPMRASTLPPYPSRACTILNKLLLLLLLPPSLPLFPHAQPPFLTHTTSIRTHNKKLMDLSHPTSPAAPSHLSKHSESLPSPLPASPPAPLERAFPPGTATAPAACPANPHAEERAGNRRGPGNRRQGGGGGREREREKKGRARARTRASECVCVCGRGVQTDTRAGKLARA